MSNYEQNMKTELLEAKLNYITLRWGVDKDSLDKIIESDPLLDMSKCARRKFKRYLESLEQAFVSLSKRYPIQDRHKTDSFLVEYHAEIRRQLGNETQFLQYLAGEWNDKILRIVSIAQKKYMIPQRIKTMSQQQPAVTFQPYSEYRKYINNR